MANRFLAQVANGEIFVRQDNGTRKLMSVRTYTNSTLSISSSNEEIRAGQGAKLYGRFNHSAGMTVQLEDAMFDMNYIRLQIGADLDSKLTGSDLYTQSFTTGASETDKTVTLDMPARAIGESCGLQDVFVWYRPSGCDVGSEGEKTIKVADGATEVALTGLTANTTYCLTYFAKKDGSILTKIGASFNPAELILVLRARLFAGDANNAKAGRPVGHITIKIPRFQLDGAFDLNMAMTSASTMTMNGTALAVNAGGCDDDGIYAEVVEVVDTETPYTDAKDIYVSEDYLTTEDAPKVYVFYKDTTMGDVPNDSKYLVFTPALGSNGKWAQAGSQKVALYKDKDHTQLVDEDTVTIA